jgi:tRNA G18 (ribose-2'-O)-methylase SpoU
VTLPRHPVLRVDDPADPRLDDYRFMRDRDLSGAREREGLLIAETLPVIAVLLDQHPGAARSVLCSDRMAERVQASVRGRAPVLVADEALLSGIAGFTVHRGVLASAERAPLVVRTPLDRPFLSADLLLACDGVRNMDNMGALFRIAAAFGVGGVLLSADAHDPLYRKSIRVSMGHALRIPFVRCKSLPASIAALREARGSAARTQPTQHDSVRCSAGAAPLRVLGADAGSVSGMPAVAVGDAVRDLPGPTMLVVGEEHSGLRPDTIAACDGLVRIPMASDVDSLNVAVAAAICLSRLREQRDATA